MNVFRRYAECYDALYQDKNYQAETDFILCLLRKHGASKGSLLDLGCGTGTYTHLLASHYRPVVGVDFSREMLALANAKLDLKSTARFVYGDIRNLRLKRKFDMAMAMFHVLSYQTTNHDLLRAFETVSRHVRAGGLFLCDFWNGPGVLRDLPQRRVKNVESKIYKIKRVATPELDPEKNTVMVRYDLSFKEKKTGKIHQLKEMHLMRYLFRPELENLCERTGFDLLEFGEWMTGKKTSLQTWNSYLVARKRRK